MERENSTHPVHATASRRGLLAMLALTFVVRGAMLLLDSDSLAPDTDNYRAIAENLRHHGTFGSQTTPSGDVVPTAFRPPLYPLLLAAVTGPEGLTDAAIACVHLVIAILSVWIVWRIGWRWLSPQAATVACILFIVDPILLNHTTRAMTETLATLLAAASLLMLTRFGERATIPWAFTAGGILGLACLARPTFLPWAGLCCLSVVIVGPISDAQPEDHRKSLLRRASRALAMFVGVVVVLSPWTIRNQQVFGKPIFTTTHGGYTLLLANNDWFYRHLREASLGDVWDASELQENLPPVNGELAADKAAYELARVTILEHPAMFLYSSIVRTWMFWTPLPHQTSSDESLAKRLARYSVAIWYLALFAFAAAGCWLVGRRMFSPPWLWAVLLVVALTAVHAIYWSNMRMRAPLIPIVALLAGESIASVMSRLSRSR